MNRQKAGRMAHMASVALALTCSLSRAQAACIQNIVLVHGAFVDGSGWRPVYDILVRKGFHVSIVQQPLTGLADDVGATRRIIDRQDGPIILVGHSYGGTIITEAGSHPKVAGLVYIAAHAPAVGETQSTNAKRFPASGREAVTPVGNGYVWIAPARFQAEFGADLSATEAAFEAASEMPTAAIGFSTPLTVAAWRTKPTWYLVAGADHIINPDLERMYAARANSRKVVEVLGASHSVYRSHPNEVAALIMDAALGVCTREDAHLVRGTSRK